MEIRRYFRPGSVEAVKAVYLDSGFAAEVSAWCPHAYVDPVTNHLRVVGRDGLAYEVGPGDFIVKEPGKGFSVMHSSVFSSEYEEVAE